jgi:phosphatidate phosphatase APP1
MAVRRWIRSALRRWVPGEPVVVVTYMGYVALPPGGPEARVRGRVLRRTVVALAGPVRGWRTFMETVAWFTTSEVPGVPVEAISDVASAHAVSDEEGYIEARVRVGPPTEARVGVKLTARRAPDTVAPAYVVPADSRPLVVSDIDDTVLITGVKERLKMVGRTLIGDPTDREVVDGMPDLLRALAGPMPEPASSGLTAPVFFVSTSPWNLYQRLADTLAHHDVPAGPMLLSDWGFGRKQMLVRPALEYKVETISGVLDDFPGRHVVLVGDSGQHDLAAYLAIAEAYPGRVRAILIREVPGLVPRDHGPDFERARAAGVTLCVGEPPELTAAAAAANLMRAGLNR